MNTNKKKTSWLTITLYIFAVVLLLCTGISLFACHASITAQLAQGATVKGNEMIIVNVYLSSCMQYFVFAVLLFVSGKVYQCIENGGKYDNTTISQQAAIIQPIYSDLDDDADSTFAEWNSKENE